MVCEANDVVCQGLAWISQNEFVASEIVDRLGTYWTSNGGAFGSIGALIKDYGQLLVGFLGGSFGFWRWYHYREKILHKRLAEYLDDNDVRLNTARHDVLAALERPGPRRKSADPLFADKELRRVLRERRWDTTSGAFFSVTLRASRELDVAIEKIERKIRTIEETLASFHNQLASAHILRGAVAATTVPHVFNSKHKRDLDTSALNHFRTALDVPGFSQNTEAKEYEAHQLRRIGDLDLAHDAYQQLEGRTESIETQRAKDIHIARCRRYRAEILQVKAIQRFRDGVGNTSGALNAYNLMVSPNRPMRGALALRNRHASVFQAWELIEQGDMLFVTAFICRKLDYGGRERHFRSEAMTAYERALTSIPPGKWRRTNTEKRLRAAAVAGKNRILASKHGIYDEGWLFPPSLQQAKDIPHGVSTASGK